MKARYRLWVMTGEHHTKAEGGDRKVHVSKKYKDTLCGTHLTHGSETGQEATIEWLNQPDPDEQLCKSCKKIALKMYNQNNRRKQHDQKRN